MELNRDRIVALLMVAAFLGLVFVSTAAATEDEAVVDASVCSDVAPTDDPTSSSAIKACVAKDPGALDVEPMEVK